MEFVLTKPQLQLLLAAMDSDRKPGHRGHPDCLKHIWVDGNRAITADTQMVAVVQLGEANAVDMPPMLIDGSAIRNLSKGVNHLTVTLDGGGYVRVKRQPDPLKRPSSAKIGILNPAAFPVWSIEDYLMRTPEAGKVSVAELKEVLSRKEFNNDVIMKKRGYFHILFADSKGELLWRDAASGKETKLLDMQKTAKKYVDIYLNPFQLKSVLRPVGLWDRDGTIEIGIQNRNVARFEAPGVQVLLSGFPYLDSIGIRIL